MQWYKMGVLKIMGAKPEPDKRIVRAGKVVTAAGVSSGIDLALWLMLSGQENSFLWFKHVSSVYRV
jgi:hypothetical protein